MKTQKLRPVHPGDILRLEFVGPLDLTACSLAADLHVSTRSVREIMRRRRAVTAEMALRLSRYFGTTARFWQNLQSQYDLEIASAKIGKQIERAIQPLAKAD